MAASDAAAHTDAMGIEEWWSGLTPGTRQWLIDHNGEPVPEGVLNEITKAGGDVTADAWWVGEIGDAGVILSDAGIDWIEAAANDE
jgi:hypothetical protein